MSETKKSLLGNLQPLIMVAMICGTVVFSVIEFRKSGVPVTPSPVNPQPLYSLADQVKAAMASDSTAALKYAALYATATNVVGDTERTPRQIQAEIGKAVDILGLQSSDEFEAIIKQHLKPFGGANPDRAAWQAKLTELAEACRGVAD